MPNHQETKMPEDTAPPESHYGVQVDRRGPVPVVTVWNQTAGQPIGEYHIHKIKDLISLGLLLAYGEF